MFHLGYLILWLFKIVPTSEFVFQDTELWPKTMFLVNLGIIGFFFGYVLAAGSKEKRPYIQPKKVPTPIWILVGLFFMTLSLGIHFGYIIVVGPATFLARGYEVFSRMKFFTPHTVLWELMPQIFLIGFSIYIISTAIAHGTIFKGKLGLILFSIQIFLLATEGARTPLVIIGSVFLVVYHYLIKPVKFRWLLLIGLSTMFIFGIIGIVRFAASFDIAKLTAEYQYAKATGQTHWYRTMAEMGGTVKTVNMTNILVPEELPYWYGRSYLVSLLHMVPYLQGILGRRGYHLLSLSAYEVLIIGGLTTRRAAGLGFSMVAEGYLNFGIIGVFLHMMLLGMWMRRLYFRFASFVTPSRALMFFASMGIFLMAIRNNTNTLFAPLGQIFAMAWLLKHICGEKDVYQPDQEIYQSYEDYADEFEEEADYTIES